jgi:hypothetical protein
MTNPIPDRRGIGVAQGLGSNYPFMRRPSPDIEHLVADFYLSIDVMAKDGGFAASFPSFPYRISWLYGLGTGSIGASPMSPVHAVDLLVVAATGLTVFDSRLAIQQSNEFLPGFDPSAGFRTTAFGPNMTIYEWFKGADVCRLVVYNNWSQDAAPLSFHNDIFPASAWLDPRTTEMRPRYIRSISALSQKFSATDVEIGSGHNIHTTSNPATPGKIQLTQVVLNASPGAGLGTYNNCTSPKPQISSINNVSPDTAGGFTIAGKDCVNVFQSTVLLHTMPRVTAPSASINPMAPNIIIRDDCKACCSCDDYVDAAKDIVSTRNQYAVIAKEMQHDRDTYHHNVHRWNSSKTCRSDHSLNLVLQAQGCPFVDVLAQYCNQSSVCQKNIQLRMRFQAAPSINTDCPGAEGESTSTLPPAPASLPAYRSTGVTVVPGSVSRSLSVPRIISLYDLQGSWCDYRAYWDAVNPFESVYVKFRLRFPHSGMADAITPYGVTAWLDGLVANKWLLHSSGTKLLATATAALRCGKR